MPILIDAHEDWAWAMLTYGRDPTVSAAETRRREQGTSIPEWNWGDCLLGWPDYQRGQTALIFATLYAAPLRAKEGPWDILAYRDANEAHRFYRDSLEAYLRLVDRAPDKYRMVTNQPDLKAILDAWQQPVPEAQTDEAGNVQTPGHPVGMVVLIEGAECIREPEEVEEWWAAGARLIGPAWRGNRYCGGTREPGPLTADGRKLLDAMASFGFALDISHMDPPAALQAVDHYDGTVVATHANPAAVVKRPDSNRFLPDRLIEALVERDGVIGITPYNLFLDGEWDISLPNAKGRVTLDAVVAHIDHICQIAGDARHVGIGSDFDGGFGVQRTPAEIDTIADVQLLAPRLMARGYSPADIDAIFHGNWLRILERTLPGS